MVRQVHVAIERVAGVPVGTRFRAMRAYEENQRDPAPRVAARTNHAASRDGLRPVPTLGQRIGPRAARAWLESIAGHGGVELAFEVDVGVVADADLDDLDAAAGEGELRRILAGDGVA
jgi:hypothetical protein